MYPYFTWTRFQKILTHDLRINTQNYLLFAGIFLAIAFIQSFNQESSFPMFLYTVSFSVFFPYGIYKWLFHKTQGVTWLLLPASPIEKYLSFWLLNVIALPLGCVAISLIGNAIGICFQRFFLGDLIYFHSWTFNIDSSDMILELFITTWMFQAPALFYIMHFKEKKFRKSVWHTALIFLAIFFLMTISVHFFRFDPEFSFGFRNFLRDFLFYAGDFLYYLFILAWLFGFWTLAFVRMRRQQI